MGVPAETGEREGLPGVKLQFSLKTKAINERNLMGKKERTNV